MASAQAHGPPLSSAIPPALHSDSDDVDMVSSRSAVMGATAQLDCENAPHNNGTGSALSVVAVRPCDAMRSFDCSAATLKQEEGSALIY